MFFTIAKKEKKRKKFFDRFKESLVKTRTLIKQSFDLLKISNKIDQDIFEYLEEKLIMADFGPSITYKLIDKLKKIDKNHINNSEMLKNLLKIHIENIFSEKNIFYNDFYSQKINKENKLILQQGIHIILLIGVNGTGKTTTAIKMANMYKKQNLSVAVVAGDTFRVAAIEQLAILAKKIHIPLLKYDQHLDPSAVIYNSIKDSLSQNIQILIIDTAGRFQTKINLIEELKKMKRVIKKQLKKDSDETFLVLDSTTGQNSLNQAKIFHQEIGITGLILTKLDGTSKGGIIIRIIDEFKIPIRYIGYGEEIDDFKIFNKKEFIDAIFT